MIFQVTVFYQIKLIKFSLLVKYYFQNKCLFQQCLVQYAEFVKIETLISYNSVSGSVVLTTVNFAYLDFFENLMISITKVAPEKKKMIMVIAADLKAYNYLQTLMKNMLTSIFLRFSCLF